MTRIQRDKSVPTVDVNQGIAQDYQAKSNKLIKWILENGYWES